MIDNTNCADCLHPDHHDISESSGKRLGDSPCFAKDPSQPDGFCRCQRFVRPRNAKEFETAILGPEPNTETVMGLDGDPEFDDPGGDDDGGQAEAAERNLLNTGQWNPSVWEGHDDRD